MKGNFDGMIDDLLDKKTITEELSTQLKTMIANHQDQEGYVMARDYVLRAYYEEPHTSLPDIF